VTREFAIVGEDEADAAGGKVSWVSPLAKAMLGARAGDVVTWQRPAGNVELEITAIRYPPARA
jgi:transcription elongation GreA/GreB family factor